MSVSNYIEITAEEALNLPSQDIKVVIINHSLTKQKSVLIEDVQFLSEDNSNDSATVTDNLLEVCLQPFEISCAGVPPTSATFYYDDSHTYNITINGTSSKVLGSNLPEFFNSFDISMEISVDPS